MPVLRRRNKLVIQQNLCDPAPDRGVASRVTGWLCNQDRDFIYYASKMAYEPDLRMEMAHRARARAELLAGAAASMDSWREVFNVIL